MSDVTSPRAVCADGDGAGVVARAGDRAHGREA